MIFDGWVASGKVLRPDVITTATALHLHTQNIIRIAREVGSVATLRRPIVYI